MRAYVPVYGSTARSVCLSVSVCPPSLMFGHAGGHRGLYVRQHHPRERHVAYLGHPCRARAYMQRWRPMTQWLAPCVCPSALCLGFRARRRVTANYALERRRLTARIGGVARRSSCRKWRPEGGAMRSSAHRPATPVRARVWRVRLLFSAGRRIDGIIEGSAKKL